MYRVYCDNYYSTIQRIHVLHVLFSTNGALQASSPSESKLAAILEDLVNGPEGPGVKLVEK